MKKLFLLMIIISTTFIYFGCQKENIKPKKIKPLTLKIYALTNNSPIGGISYFRPRFNQHFRPSSMKLFVDNKLINTTKSSPWYIMWDTSNQTAGSKHLVYLSITGKNDFYGNATVNSKPINLVISNINFTIFVKTPKNTPIEDRIFIAGNRKDLGMKPTGEWSPRTAVMKRVSRNLWKKTIKVGFNENIEYEFTRSSWATKGQNKNGHDMHINASINGRSKIFHTIDNWGLTRGISQPKGPTVCFGKDASSMATIFWETKVATPTILHYGIKNIKHLYKKNIRTRYHYAKLKNLKSATQYIYTTGNKLSGHFKTAITAGKEKVFSFLVFGDFQGGNKILNWIKNHEKVDFIIHTGDMVNDGYNENQWNQYFGWLKPVASLFTIMTVPGNHEHEAPQYYRYHPLPGNKIYYSFIYGNSEFFMIDSERDFTANSTQYLWLKKALKRSKRNRKIRWRIATFHTPSYSTGKHGSDKIAQKFLEPLFDKYGVNLVLNGHDHAYQITKPMFHGKPAKRGIVHVISGGAGATLFGFKVEGNYIAFRKKCYNYCKYTVYKNMIQHKALTDSGKLLHETKILPR